MQLWATDLSLEAVNLDDRDQLTALGASFPARVGLVIGSESTGISQEMLAAAVSYFHTHSLLQQLKKTDKYKIHYISLTHFSAFKIYFIPLQDRRIYYPLHGFSESLNLSVATALVLQRLFDVCPSARGDMSEEEKRAIRADWYAKLAHTAWQVSDYLHVYIYASLFMSHMYVFAQYPYRICIHSQRIHYARWAANPPVPLADLRRLEEHRGAWLPPKIISKNAS